MATITSQGEHKTTYIVVISSAVRAAFGLIWAINAYLTWQPGFSAHYVGYLQNASNGQPVWLQPWFSAWLGLVTPAAGIFVWLTRIIETLIAIGLLFGLGRKWIYGIGAIFSLLIWSTAEGFGGPYTSGVTNFGPALVYVLVFIALIIMDRELGKSPYSLDFYIEKRFPGWERIAEWAPPGRRREAPRQIPWRYQSIAITLIVLAAIFYFTTLQSALGGLPSTPANAAAAVSPLSLASAAPAAQVRDAKLPPLLGEGDSVNLTIISTDVDVEIASGVNYKAWTFGGSVPGPIIHVRQGQTVNVTFKNQGEMQHSIDFHAAEIAPSVAYRSINPGDQIQFSFVANVPGVFIYHCGTPPVMLHMANGMYGALVVDPTEPLPPVDASYVLVQSEWYTSQVNGNLLTSDFKKMQAANPDEVVFNGSAFQYRDHPLPVKSGQTVRLYVVDAGPNLPSAFHVIGGIFTAVYPDGDASHAQSGVSTYEIAPGQGVVFDIKLTQPGKYPFVDHSMRSMQIGAMGMFEVSP
ncbi:MAG: multicopper oxidase domain-containing protein [Omnitrophica WOR_2 bacterium]